MSRQYNNIIKHLGSHFEIVTSQDDFYKMKELEREFSYKCKAKGHTNEIKITSYINKRALFNKDKLPLQDFCPKCVKDNEDELSFEQYVDRILQSCGHLLIHYDPKSRDAVYICCNCNETNKTQIGSLCKNLGSCPNCQNHKFRLSYDKLKNDVESHGFTLLTKPEQYTSNKQKLDVICKCGNKYQTYLVSIRQDKHCKETCKTLKYEQTCTERYNERNAMHIDKNFYKCQETYITTKQHTLPETNRTITIQGTENIVLEYILNNENKILKRIIKEDDILQQNIPSFYYTFENKQHKYYPDFHIKDTKLLIEAKTIETHNKGTHYIKNYLKYKSVVSNGYHIMVIILDNNYKLYDIWYFLNDGTEYSVLKHNGIDISFDKRLSNRNKLTNIKELCDNFDLIKNNC